jgi:hypothetical protein
MKQKTLKQIIQKETGVNVADLEQLPVDKREEVEKLLERYFVAKLAQNKEFVNAIKEKK